MVAMASDFSVLREKLIDWAPHKQRNSIGQYLCIGPNKIPLLQHLVL